MIRSKLCVIYLLLSAQCMTGQFYLGGIAVEHNDLSRHFDKLVETGMNTVELTHYARQGSWDTSDLDITYPKDDVLDQIKMAKDRGLRIILILRVYLKPTNTKNAFLWHGMILPKSNSQLERWFAKYKAYILEWAEIAESNNVDALVLGSELNELASTIKIKKLPSLYAYYQNEKKHINSTNRILKFKSKLRKHHLVGESTTEYNNVSAFVKDKIRAEQDWYKQVGLENAEHQIDSINARRVLLEKHWRDIIETTRRVYNGKLSYAANFDNYKEISFWDALDFVGINAYFPLMDDNQSCSHADCIYEVCKKSWLSALQEIEEFKKNLSLEIPVLFTELGYTQKKEATKRPWQSRGYSIVGSWYKERLIQWQDQPQYTIERVAALKALYDVVDVSNFDLSGILYWKLSSDPCSLDIEPYTLMINDSKDPLLRYLLKFQNAIKN